MARPSFPLEVLKKKKHPPFSIKKKRGFFAKKSDFRVFRLKIAFFGFFEGFPVKNRVLRSFSRQKQGLKVIFTSKTGFPVKIGIRARSVLRAMLARLSLHAPFLPGVDGTITNPCGGVICTITRARLFNRFTDYIRLELAGAVPRYHFDQHSERFILDAVRRGACGRTT